MKGRYNSHQLISTGRDGTRPLQVGAGLPENNCFADGTIARAANLVFPLTPYPRSPKNRSTWKDHNAPGSGGLMIFECFAPSRRKTLD